MRTRPELLLLQKTMVVVEGVARTLDPKLDMWSDRRAGGARMDRAQSRPGRQARRRGAGRRRNRPFLGQVPWLLTRAGTSIDQFDDITRDGLVLSPETVAAIGAEARRIRWTAAALWTIAALLAWAILLR